MPLSTFCTRCREAAVRVQCLCVVPASVTASGLLGPEVARCPSSVPPCPPPAFWVCVASLPAFPGEDRGLQTRPCLPRPKPADRAAVSSGQNSRI